MSDLVDYILKHSVRGECQCGKCIDKGPERPAPEHSVNVHFFWVSTKNDPKPEKFRELVEKFYPDLERLKAGPSYIELGGVFGDQGLALQFIGLGALLKLWPAVTPESLGMKGETADMMAGRGDGHGGWIQMISSMFMLLIAIVGLLYLYFNHVDVTEDTQDLGKARCEFVWLLVKHYAGEHWKFVVGLAVFVYYMERLTK